MTVDFNARRLLTKGEHLAAVVMAATVTLSIVAGLALAFGGLATAPWLVSDQELVELVAECDRQPARASRERCKKAIVSARLEALASPSPLAKR